MLTLTSSRSSSVFRWFVLSIFALLAAVSLVAWSADAARAAQVPPRPDSGAVLDQADILSDTDEQRINERIGRGNEQNEFIRAAVLTVNGVDGDFEDFTRQTAREWGVGEAGRNNGVLIVADMDERELRIEVADGAREVLSDATAEDIMEDQLEPGFRDEEYAQAFTATLDSVYDQSNPEAAAQAAADRERTGNIVMWVLLGIAGLVVAVVAGSIVWWSKDQKKVREQADREIERYQREHPDEEISDEVRKRYYKYRSNHRKPPKDSKKPPKAKDQDGVERDVQYASTFQSWLPLYVMYPAIYSGTNHSISSSGSSGSAGTSFGGGGGFSGGGASGSF